MEEGSVQVLGQFSLVSMVLRTSAEKKKKWPWMALAFKVLSSRWWCQCFKLLNLLCWCPPNPPLGFRCAVFCLSLYLRLPSAGTQHNTYFKTNTVTIQGGNCSGIFILKHTETTFHCHFMSFQDISRNNSDCSPHHRNCISLDVEGSAL